MQDVKKSGECLGPRRFFFAEASSVSNAIRDSGRAISLSSLDLQ